jgi:hypothetical protein
MAEEETILCAKCGKDLVMKFIEIKDKVFCSTSCFEDFKNSMSRKEFYQQYGDIFKPDEQKWVPKYANDYIKMCGYCPSKLAETCREELDISGVYHDDVVESETMHWCCHARFILSAALSDGTVPWEVGRKAQAHAEELARKDRIRGVTTIHITSALADLAKSFDYKPMKANPPEPKPMAMSHAAACLLCNPDFAKECESLVIKEFEAVHDVKKLVKSIWCQHTVQALADIYMTRDKRDREEAVKKVMQLAEQVAKEKGHPGVITRDLFVALGRACS